MLWAQLHAWPTVSSYYIPMVSTAMSEFNALVDSWASLGPATSEGLSSGTLVEQMRKQALANQAEQDEEKEEEAEEEEEEEEDGQDASERAGQQADELAAYAAMQEEEEAEDQEIHDLLMNAPRSRPSN